MLYVVEIKYASGNLVNGQYISLKENANVHPSTVNWRLAIGYHAFWIRAQFSYLSQTDRLKLDFYVQATDRYNFDRNASGIKRIINIYNGVFVKSGLAKHFNSYGIIQEAHQWNRGTYI